MDMVNSDMLQRNKALSYNADLINNLKKLVQEDCLYSHVSNIFESDRHSNFKAYNATATWIKNTMLSYGLDDVELQHIPADGKTLLSDWIAPLAWDADEAYLDITYADNEKLRLCDYRQMPDSVIMGSQPTSAEGVTGALVDVDQLDLLTQRIDGCVAFTTRRACDVKKMVFEAGGLAVVSCFHPFPDEGPDSLFWNNCWADRKGGWWQTAGDCRLAGFSISPNAGADLQERLAGGEIIQAHAFVDGSIHEGSLPFVTGRVTGSELPEEEILVLSHLYEHGAHDNGTGSGTNLEIARAIAAGVASGELERPKRSLRFLFMAECYGTIAYAQYRPERIKTTKAAISLDGVGAAWPLNVHREADCSRSPVAPLIAAVANEYYQDDEDADIKLCTVEVSDTLLADPNIGVPTSWPHRASKEKTWHTSLDTIDKIDTTAMKGMAVTVATSLLRFASLTGQDARYIATLCAEQSLQRLSERPVDAKVLNHEKNTEMQAIQMLAQFSTQESLQDVEQAVRAIKVEFNKQADAAIEHIINAQSEIVENDNLEYHNDLPQTMVLQRNQTGHLSLDPLSDEDFFNVGISPRWNAWQIAAYWWIDGKRNVGEIFDLLYGEFQTPLQALTKYYLTLIKHKYINIDK